MNLFCHGSVPNVLQYYINSVDKLDSCLVNFINVDPTKLIFDYEKFRTDHGARETDALYQNIMLCNTLLDEKYEVFISEFNKSYEEFSFEGISHNKLNILIKHNVIYMNEVNLQFMRKVYPDQLMFFIYSNIVLYVGGVINVDNFIFSELISLLEKDIDDSYKLSLLTFTSEPILLRGMRYSESIKLHILKNNLNKNDIPHLMNGYDNENLKLKTMLETIGIEQIDLIIENEYNIVFDSMMR